SASRGSVGFSRTTCPPRSSGRCAVPWRSSTSPDHQPSSTESATMNPIDIKCPRCGAAPGQKCKDYRGKGAAPHRDRKKAADPQAEHMRLARLKTEQEKAKAVKETPLFAEEALESVRTPEENYWRTRFMVAGIKENQEPFAGFHSWWQAGFLKRLAAK